jgi:phasin
MDVAVERKTKKSDSSTDFASFDMSKFGMPKFEFPNMELPEAFRGFVQNGAAQTKDMCEKAKKTAEEATNLLESTYATAAKGATDYNLKVVEMARINTGAAFNYMQALLGVTDFSEFIKLSTDHAHQQIATLTEQTKVLTTLAQRTATQISEPIKTEVCKAFNKV